MKTITVSNQKGGVGKTATVVNLAGYLSREHNQSVLVMDLDTQGNASWSLADSLLNVSAGEVLLKDCFDVRSWRDSCSRSLSSGIAVVAADSVLADIDSYDIKTIVTRMTAFLSEVGDMGVDIVLIDTPPSLGKALTSALLVSDYVICPIELEAYSLQGVGKLQNVISNIRKYNKNLQVLGLLPSMVDNRNKRHREQLALITESYPSLVIRHSIGLRSSIADALSEKTFLGDIKKSSARKAKQEFSELASWIFEAISEEGKNGTV
ncbi:ParA family protein [Ruminobacter sp. RM87]|uniref:ParA family protein n=1 Tax=Ruminobacter sp. RM87 TaxID=1200567 RepID=UPI0004E24327|nr:ParA family protein [Ruminobacter sp. RM87]